MLSARDGTCECEMLIIIVNRTVHSCRTITNFSATPASVCRYRHVAAAAPASTSGYFSMHVILLRHPPDNVTYVISVFETPEHVYATSSMRSLQPVRGLSRATSSGGMAKGQDHG